MVKRSWVFVWGVGIVLAFTLDQWTKWWFAKQPLGAIRLIPGLSLDFTKNFGLAFGLSLNRWVIVALSVVLLVFLFWFGVTEWRNQHQLAAGASLLMCAGAMGNLVDRLRFGYVVDWINVEYWSVFNLADVWISLGAVLILIQYWKHDYGKKAKNT